MEGETKAAAVAEVTRAAAATAVGWVEEVALAAAQGAAVLEAPPWEVVAVMGAAAAAEVMAMAVGVGVAAAGSREAAAATDVVAERATAVAAVAAEVATAAAAAAAGWATEAVGPGVMKVDGAEPHQRQLPPPSRSPRCQV